MDSNDEEKKEKNALLCLMALGDDVNVVYDSNLSHSSDNNEIDDLSSQSEERFEKYSYLNLTIV